MPGSWVERIGWLIVLVLLPTSAWAADGPPIGSWRVQHAAARVNDRIESEIEKLSAEIAAVYRPVARQLLRKAMRPCSQLAIWLEADAVAIQCDAQKVAVAAPDGRPVAYTGHDGRTHELMLRQENQSLIQQVITARGTRTTRYSRVGELLQVEVTISSPQLPREVSYSVTYR